VTIIQNIETVKAFNTFLDETILKTTQKIIQKSTNPFELNIFNTPENEAEAGSLVDQETSSPIKEM